MFRRLQQKWKVNFTRVVLILITFSVGGSLCGYLGRKLLVATLPDLTLKSPWWWVLYLLLVTLLWPLCVMLISVPMGQFSFFKNYLGRMARRMGFGKKAAKTKDASVRQDAV